MGLDNRSRLQVVHGNMMNRCHNPKNPRYARYGGRGIYVCADWWIFENFEAWALSSGYEAHFTIDRVKNNLGYDPGNCRWATYRTQARNKGKRAGGTSKFIGVSWYPRNEKWSASVFVDNKNQYLGLFADEEEAARARDAYIVENDLHGFNLNFPYHNTLCKQLKEQQPCV